MPTAQERVRRRTAAAAMHRQPMQRPPAGYPNWDADAGVWRSDHGVPQPTMSADERRRKESAARQQRKLAAKAKQAAERAERERRGERARGVGTEGEAVKQADGGAG